MASWGTRRRTMYSSIFVLTIAAIGIGWYFLFVYKPASCTDKVHNGDEMDVDCGGSCPILCSFQVPAPSVLWSRSFELVPGVYNAVAYVNNPNIEYSAKTAAYKFKLYDKNNVLITEKDGITLLPSNATVPIYEPAIKTGSRPVERTFFEITSVPDWTKQQAYLLQIALTTWQVEDADTAPRLSATIKNNGTVGERNIPVIAVLFDTNGNAVAVSKTIVNSIAANASKDIFFTWPRPFAKDIVSVSVFGFPQI